MDLLDVKTDYAFKKVFVTNANSPMTLAFLSHLDYNLWLFRLPVMQELVRQGHTVYAICPNGEMSSSLCPTRYRSRPLHYLSL